MSDEFFNEVNKTCPDWLVGDPDRQPIRTKINHQLPYGGVIQMDTEGKEIERFLSARLASKALGVTAKNIRAAAQLNRTCGGYLWSYITDGNRHESQTQASQLPAGGSL